MGAGGSTPATPSAPVWQAVDDVGSSATRSGNPKPSPYAVPHTPFPRQAVDGTGARSSNPSAAPRTPMPPATPSVATTSSGWTTFTGDTLSGTIAELAEQRFETVNTTGNQVAGQVVRGLVTAPFRAIGLLVGLLFAPLRFLLMPSLARSPRSSEADRMQIPGTPFVLRTDGGQETECYLRGEVTGGFIRLGDRVEVTGRMNPTNRVFRVSKLVNQRTHAVTRGHVDPRARFASFKAVMAVLLLFVVVLIVSSWPR